MRIESPASEREIVECVRRAGAEALEVRAAGSGHSFTPLVATDGVLVSLDAWSGVESADADRHQARVRAGTKIHDLGPPLFEHGLALENQGDVDTQSIAGALGTGTHGTGRTLGNLSTQAVALRLVTASGDVVECSSEDDPDLFRAARVGLGALGILSVATLRLLPAYRLHERIWRVPMEDALGLVDDLVSRNRHFEFFWYPRLDSAEMKTLNPTVETSDGRPGQDGERIGWSQDIISSVREHKFNEMEYSVPAEHGLECFRELRARMREKHADVVWPVEYRSVKPDDAFLSPTFERETVTISVHQDARLEYRDFFGDVESIFLDCNGRPHWGKVHTRTAADLRALYPEWERFHAVRRRLDPEGRFLNAYLRNLFGEESA